MKRGVAGVCAWLVIWLLMASSSIASLDHELVLLQRRRPPHPGVATLDISADGRFIAFESSVGLVSADTNQLSDIYVVDRSTGRVTWESMAVDGGAADGTSTHPRLSADGRYVVFASVARDLVAPSAARAQAHVYLRDRRAGVTQRISETADGQPADRASDAPDISEDGRVVVFHSAATNLIAGDTAERDAPLDGTTRQVYRFDIAGRTLTPIGVDTVGRASSSGSSFDPAVSGDGRVVAFTSTAPLDNARPSSAAVSHPARGHDASRKPPSNAAVFVRDVSTATTRLVSRRATGERPNGASFSAAISADGRRVTFASVAADLGPRDRNHVADVYVHDLTTGETILVSQREPGRAADGSSSYPAISADGRFVAFTSEASDLWCGHRCSGGRRDQNLVADIYVADTASGAIARISRGDGPEQESWEASGGAAVDAAGRIVAFSSFQASADDDLAHDFDAFVRILPRTPD